jgi:hypothetical protein
MRVRARRCQPPAFRAFAEEIGGAEEGIECIVAASPFFAAVMRRQHAGLQVHRRDELEVAHAREALK